MGREVEEGRKGKKERGVKIADKMRNQKRNDTILVVNQYKSHFSHSLTSQVEEKLTFLRVT